MKTGNGVEEGTKAQRGRPGPAPLSPGRLIAWHLTAWILIIGLFTIPLFVARNFHKGLYVCISLLIYIAVFYINTGLILAYWTRKRKPALVLLSWSALLLACTLLSVLLDHLLRLFERGGNVPLELINALFKNGLFVLIFLFVSTAYQSITDWFKNDKIRSRLENESLRTELAFLKLQANPHFLFNTLNSLYILAYQRSDKTAGAIMKLSELMQYTLYGTNRECVPLSKEIFCIRNLIELQQIRMKERLCIVFNVAEDSEDYTIPPLLLLPFVENLFKHGISNDESDPLLVELQTQDNKLIFHTRNRIGTCMQAAASKTGLSGIDERAFGGDPGRGQGIGLSNVQRRLKLLYPGRHQLRIEETDTHFSIYLILN